MQKNTKKEELAMSKISNKRKILAVGLLSIVGLAACSSNVQAKPSDYDENLLTFLDNDQIYHNLVSIVEDAYHDGSESNHVLEKVLYLFANSAFGTYNEVTRPTSLKGEKTLKAVAKDIYHNSTIDPVTGKRTTDASKLDAKTVEFIDAHTAYHTVDNEGNRVTDAAAKQAEFDRVMAKWQTIEDRIAIAMYNDIIGGSYSERELFSEKKFLVSLRAGLKAVKNPYDAATVTNENVLFTPSTEDKEVFTDHYLNRDNYQEQACYDLDAADEVVDQVKVKYVEEELIPTIYRTLLVEQYLLDESYNTLGRSYARKVNVLQIGTNNNNKKAASYLMQEFVREYISKGNKTDLDSFNNISKINVGTRENIEEVSGGEFASATTQEYMAQLGYDYVAPVPGVAESDYYLGTDYGDMMMDYLKIKDDILTTNTTVENEFTDNQKYSKETGKLIKERKLANKDYTKNGWYIKNGGLSDLPSEIRTRLFNIGVANALNNDATQDRWDPDTATYSVPGDESNYVAKINGKYYLKVAQKESGADAKDDILFNDGGTFYVIQIEEAISASKLSKESTTYESTAKEEIINEVAKVIANDDSYKTLSTKHWLEKALLNYHDTTVYNYFKSNYPELFD